MPALGYHHRFVNPRVKVGCRFTFCVSAVRDRRISSLHQLSDCAGFSGCVRTPCAHQSSSPLKQVRSCVCSFYFVSDRMGQRSFGNFTANFRAFTAPIAEGTSKAMGCNVGTTHPFHEGFKDHDRLRARSSVFSIGFAREDQFWIESLCFLQNFHSFYRERNTMRQPRLHAHGRNGPSVGVEVNFFPSSSARFTRPHCSEDDKFESTSRHALAAR